MRLSYYLTSRLLPVFILYSVLALGLSLAIYWFALDDTSEFYMYQDGLDFIATKKPVDTEFKTIASRINELNIQDQQVFEQLAEVNSVWLISDDYSDRYYLKYQTAPDSPMVYIVHRFDSDDSFDIRPYLVGILVLSSLVLSGVVLRVLAVTRKQTDLFVDSIKQLDTVAPHLFEEFSLAQQVISKEITEKHQAVDREKLFASFLSHEIRHPLTLMGHQISRFDQLDNMSQKVLSLVAQIKQSQQHTVGLSEAILSLWQEDTPIQTCELVYTLKTWQQASSLDITLDCDCTEFYTKLSQPQFELLLSEIGANFSKYGQGQLLVSMTDSSLSFTNRIKAQANSLKSYGVGSFIIKAIAHKAGWQSSQQIVREEYRLTFNF